MICVRTRFGSLKAPGGVEGGGATSGAAALGANAVCGALGRGCGGTGSETGCSSRGTMRSVVVVPMRSWNGLPCASAGAATGGTIFAGAVSALMTGGLAVPPEPDVKAR